MPRTITLPDEIYERLERLAASQHQTPGDLLVKWLVSLPIEQASPFLPADTRFTQFLRGLGLDDELIAHVQSAPEEQQPRELLLALQALADEQAGRDPLRQPRYLTFEQFFSELGHTTSEIDEAKRQAARHADI